MNDTPVRASSSRVLIAALLAGLAMAGCLDEPASEVDAPARTKSATTRIMLVGDSITQGSAGDVTWRLRLWRHLQAVAPGAVDFVGDRTFLYDNVAGAQGSQAYADAGFDRDHHALWGRTVLEEKDTIAAAVAQHQPRVLCILMGINDLAFRTSPQQTFDNLTQLIASARAARPDLQIVVGMVLTRYNFWTRAYEHVAEVGELNARIATLPALGTERSPLRVARTDVGWDARLHTWDGTHANSTGEVRIAAAFADALATLGVGAAFGAPWPAVWPAAPASLSAHSTAATPGPVIEPPVAVGVDRGARLRWESAPSATGFLIRQRRAGDAEEQLPWAVEGTSFEPRFLFAGSHYEFHVVPVNDHGKNRLSWSPVPGATGYIVHRRDATAGEPWAALPYPVVALSFDDQVLHADHAYEYLVEPHKGTMPGLMSPKATVMTRRFGPVSPPSNLVRVKGNVGRRQRAADFARHWGDPSREQAWDARYTYLGRDVDDDATDCAHFVSEALLQAGWGEVGRPAPSDWGASRAEFLDPSYWWRVGPSGPLIAGGVYGSWMPFSQRNASMSFTMAHDLREHIAGRASGIEWDPRMLDYGDVIAFDLFGDSAIDHTAIVSGFDDDGWPLYSQHTPSRSGASLRAYLDGGGARRLEYWHLLELDGY